MEGAEVNRLQLSKHHFLILHKGFLQPVSAERGTNVTMLTFINALGGTVSPVFVYPRKKVLPAKSAVCKRPTWLHRMDDWD